MDILDVGINKGVEIGREQGVEIGREQEREKGIQAVIETCLKFKVSKEDALKNIILQFDLPENKAQEYMEKYWR